MSTATDNIDDPIGLAKVAYLAPLADFGAVLRAFWPLIATYAALIVAALALPATNVRAQITNGTYVWLSTSGTLGLAVVVAAVYLWLVTTRGAIAWHRRLILGAPIEWIVPVPDFQSVRYGFAGIAIWLIVVVCLAFAFVPLVVMVGGLFGEPSLDANSAIAVSRAVTRPVAIVLGALVNAVLYALIIIVFARLAMWLPKIAVEADDSDWLAHVPVRRILLFTAIPLTFVISLLPLLGDNWVTQTVATFGRSYALLVALSGLSLAFRLRHAPPSAS